MIEASSFRPGEPPRELTAALRAELGLPFVKRAPYRWAFACVVVGTACVPLVLASLWTLTVLAIVVGLVVVPAVQWFEYRDAEWREVVYRTGKQAIGQVIEIEPPGSRRRDHIVQVEFSADGARVRAAVIGCPLARNGLGPGESVVVLYDARAPARCIVVGRARLEIVDAIFEA